MLILHGDNNSASRQALLEARSAGAAAELQLLDYSGAALTLAQLVSASESTSLLGQTCLVTVSDLFARRQGREKMLLLDYLKSHPTAPVIVWEGKDVTAQLTGFAAASVRKFDLPKYIFKFLDTLSLDYYRRAVETTSAEQIMALLIRRIHDLILTKSGSNSGPDWKARQLLSQSSAFSETQLLQLHHQLLAIDFAQKTSALPYNLSAALELWVIKAHNNL